MMGIVIKISDEDYQLMKDGHIPFSILDKMRNGTPLDSIIADIEAARDKDKLCEYPYNRCIEILRMSGEDDLKT